MPARRVFAWEPEEQWTSSEEREKKIEKFTKTRILDGAGKEDRRTEPGIR